jgi:hypothetical protein
LSARVDGADVKNCRDARDKERQRGRLSGTRGAICEYANTELAHAHKDAEIHSEVVEEEEGLFQANTVNEVDAEEEEVEALKTTAMNEEEEEECMDASYRQHDVWV